jgi:hypothetical protein
VGGVCISRELLETDLSKIRCVLNGKFECFIESTRCRISLRLEGDVKEMALYNVVRRHYAIKHNWGKSQVYCTGEIQSCSQMSLKDAEERTIQGWLEISVHPMDLDHQLQSSSKRVQ